MSINSSLVFGARLRAHREHRGITLAALAESMKVRQSLLEDLERNDVSRWPPGIYGRAVVREYAKSIGLPASETLEEFCGLFSEPHDQDRAAFPQPDVATNPSDPQLRLTLAGDSPQTPRVMWRRLVGAVIELTVVVTAGYVVAAMTGLRFWTGNAIVALTWYPFRTVFCGHQTWSRILRLLRFSTSRSSRTTELPGAPNPIAVGGSQKMLESES